MSTVSSPETAGTSPRRTRLSRAQRAEQIRASAVDCALTEGLSNLTHRSLATRLGVTHSLIAHYEPDIEALRAYAYNTLISDEFSHAQKDALSASTATGALSILIERMSVSGREEYSALWLDGWSIGRTSPQMAKIVRSAMDSWQGMVEAVIRRGRAAGEFKVEEPAGAAWEFIALLDGLNSHMVVAYPGPGTYRERLHSALEHRLNLSPGALDDALRVDP